MKKLPIVILSSIALSSCAVSAKNDGVMKAEERSGGFMGLSTNQAVEVESESVFKGKNTVVIGGFKVGFNESKRLQNKSSGLLGGGGFGGKSTGLVKLEGIDDATRQAITDAAYNNFVASLKAKGYTVVDHKSFVNSEEFKGTKTYDFPYEHDDSGMLSSYGVARYFSPTEIGKQQPIFMGEIPGVTGGFAFANPMHATAGYAEKNKTTVLNVSYLLDFSGKGGHAGITSSSLEVGQLLSVDQGFLGATNGASDTFTTNSGNLKRGQPVPSSKQFATIESNTSDAEVGLETAGNVLSAVLGGGTNQTREYIFKADKAKYQEAAIDALSRANDSFTGKMATLK